MQVAVPFDFLECCSDCPELDPPLETQVLSGHCALVSLRVLLLRCWEGLEAAA